MTGKRKRYAAEFKARVAMEALRGELTVAVGHQARRAPDDDRRLEAAGHGRAGGGVLRQTGGEGGHPGRGLEKLHAKIGQLVVERDFLAKASGR